MYVREIINGARPQRVKEEQGILRELQVIGMGIGDYWMGQQRRVRGEKSREHVNTLRWRGEPQSQRSDEATNTALLLRHKREPDNVTQRSTRQ